MIYDIPPANNYVGNNHSNTFDFDFYIEDESQLKVVYFDKNNGKKILKYNIDYSIKEFKNPNGSSIVFPLEGSTYSVLNTQEKISLELTLPILQDTQYNNSSLLNLKSLEYSFDYLTRLIQILARKLYLCVKVDEFSSKTPEQLVDSIYSTHSDVIKLRDEIKDTHAVANDLLQSTKNQADFALSQANYAKKYADNAKNTVSDVNQKLDATIKNNTVSNCIIEAPNNGITYSGSRITIPRGLKVLMPDGRNTDHSLKNYSYTLDKDINIEISSSWASKFSIFLLDNSEYAISAKFIVSDTKPLAKDCFWYSTKENLLHRISSGVIINENRRKALLGWGYHNEGVITSLDLTEPLEFLKRNDIYDYVVDFATFPTGSWYRLYKSGWLEQGGHVHAVMSSITFPRPFVSPPFWHSTEAYGVEYINNGSTATATYLNVKPLDVLYRNWYAAGIGAI